MIFALRVVITTIFILSAIGKLQNQKLTLEFMRSFLYAETSMIKLLIWVLITIEFGIAITIWIPSLLRRFIYPLFVLIVIFLFAALISISRGIDCGCFGTLPLISQLSPLAHLLLLVGLLVGFIVLVLHAKHVLQEKTEKLQWLSVSAILLIVTAFLSIPIQSRVSCS